MDKLLNAKFINELRYTVNETDIFIKDDNEKEKFKLICAAMDRIDTAIDYINRNYNKVPKNEEQFIVYLFYCCNIVEIIRIIFNKLSLDMPQGNNYFEDVWNNIKNGKDIPEDYTDDDFFKYFRALVFAHPTDTSRAIPDRLDKEIQYSPYILLEDYRTLKDEDTVGVEIYSDKRENFHITFEFGILNKYIKWKYELVNTITKVFQSIIKDKEEKWKEHKVNRTLDNIDVLKDIREILEERYMDVYTIEKLIDCLECENTLRENEKAVKEYRTAIIEIIPQLCDAMDEYKPDKIYDIVKEVLNPEYDIRGYPMMHYQLEKIYCCLDESYQDTKWGLIQADKFANQFAKKWVTIKTKEMNFKEIKMLTRVACYLEYKEQIGARNEQI